jgi:FdhE protein
MASFDGIAARDCDHLQLFRFSICHDLSAIESMSDSLGLEHQAFKAVALLFAVPFLSAAGRRLSSAGNQSWTEGYCPICGAWPAFGEVRGIERTRYFRCGRCTSAWEAHCLLCPFCGMDNHEELGSLVPAKSDGEGTIEICRRCFGYIKTFTLLQPTASDEIMARDLASVALDLAALHEGYKRPEGLGYAIDICIAPAPSLAERILSWRT